MPKGPNGQKRPADVIGMSTMVARIATGEVVENLKQQSGRVRSGKAGAKARAKKLSGEQRRAIAKKAATTRWGM